MNTISKVDKLNNWISTNQGWIIELKKKIERIEITIETTKTQILKIQEKS